MTRNSIIGIVVALLFALVMWTFVDWVMIPHQQERAERLGLPRGNLSDLYPRWLAAREWLLHRRNPYGEDVTREIQRGYWGRELNPANPNDPRDQAGFAYPAYVIFFLAPTIFLPFRTLKFAFELLLILLTAASVPLWDRGVGSGLRRSALMMAFILLIGSWPAVQGLHLQQLTLVVAALLAGTVACLAQERPVLAGVLLAVATIKPQLAFGLSIWLALWTLADLRRRQRVAWAFLVSMIVLIGGAEWLMPGWIWHWRGALHSYLIYNEAAPLLHTLFGQGAGRALEAIVAGFALVVCWRCRRAQAGSREFGLATAVVMAAELLLMPKWAPYDQVLLLPGALWVASNWADVRATRAGRAFSTVTVAALGWQWISAAALVTMATVSLRSAWRFDVLPIATVLAVPVLGFALLALVSLRKFSDGQRNENQGSATAEVRSGTVDQVFG